MYTPTLYPPVRKLLAQALQDVFNKGFFSDQVLEYYFKQNRKWGSRDRKAFAFYLYGVVRWLRPLMKVAELPWKEAWSPRNDVIADFTALKDLGPEDYEKLIEVYEAQGEKLEQNSYFEGFDTFALKYSLSDYCLGLFESEFKGDIEAELKASNQPAPVYIRANTLKVTRDELKAVLEQEDIETEYVEAAPEALVLKERKPIFKSKAFQNGFFEMQDAGSQLIGEFVEVEPGHKVIDACAGAGGKSLSLSARMKNKGRLIAMDIHARKLEELTRRARRAGVFNLEVREIDSTKPIKRLAQSADRLLLDVPCTGSGVLRRNPDSKWRISEYEKQSLKQTQKKILEQYSSMVKPGGKLIYSTCSLLASENEEQIKSFLESEPGKNFEWESERSFSPSQTGFDGFYMARVKRK